MSDTTCRRKRRAPSPRRCWICVCDAPNVSRMSAPARNPGSRFERLNAAPDFASLIRATSASQISSAVPLVGYYEHTPCLGALARRDQCATEKASIAPDVDQRPGRPDIGIDVIYVLRFQDLSAVAFWRACFRFLRGLHGAGELLGKEQSHHTGYLEHICSPPPHVYSIPEY